MRRALRIAVIASAIVGAIFIIGAPATAATTAPMQHPLDLRVVGVAVIVLLASGVLWAGAGWDNHRRKP